MHLLGLAFLRKGMTDLAVKQLEQALEGQGGVNEKTLPIAYALGQAHEQAGNPGEARSWYAKIFELDIGYRDVAEKVSSLETGG